MSEKSWMGLVVQWCMEILKEQMLPGRRKCCPWDFLNGPVFDERLLVVKPSPLTMLSSMNSLLLSMPAACRICSYKSLSLPSEETCQSVTYSFSVRVQSLVETKRGTR